MLKIRLSITLFNKYQTCELTEKEAVYMLESLRKVPCNKGNQRPFVCITGYHGMALHILEGNFEDFPPYMLLKQGIAYNGYNKNIRWPIANKNFETDQIAVFSKQLLNDTAQLPAFKLFYQAPSITQPCLFTHYPANSAYTENPSSPSYEPELWNNDINILANNNCYTYALNIKGLRQSSGKDPNQTAFGNIIKNCQSDGLHIVSTVTDNHKHLIALFASSPFSDTNKARTDYHFFRRDANGEWSHKNGHCNVSNRDFSGRIIDNIMTCDRSRFQYFYCFFHVTDNTLKKVSERIQTNTIK
ncbi:hypothetical protein [Emticicia sp. BO119]|uniref:hypothetical protein n=1 Tax=Emticicia sp. BO119 TaxID=2757768 RepID=UPI0015F1228E|nr:hypothetical protein [Emticicia sp. BO119]MBA4853845.1 hypothetical protein [Emticicia sp. BO119]